MRSNLMVSSAMALISISSASMISGSRIEFSAGHTWKGAFIGNDFHQRAALEAHVPVPLPRADHPRDHAGKQQHERAAAKLTLAIIGWLLP